MTPKEALIAAKNRIADPAHWTQGAYARMANGDACQASSPNAVKWCVAGSLYAANAPSDAFNMANAALMKCAKSTTEDSSYAYINDYGGHDAVMKLLDCAIASL